MNYYYDPILGLQYDYIDDLFLLYFETIPIIEKFDVEKWIKYLSSTGVYLLECKPNSSIQRIVNITGYKL